jgi:hypothetical protein
VVEARGRDVDPASRTLPVEEVQAWWGNDSEALCLGAVGDNNEDMIAP